MLVSSPPNHCSSDNCRAHSHAGRSKCDKCHNPVHRPRAVSRSAWMRACPTSTYATLDDREYLPRAVERHVGQECEGEDRYLAASHARLLEPCQPRGGIRPVPQHARCRPSATNHTFPRTTSKGAVIGHTHPHWRALVHYSCIDTKQGRRRSRINFDLFVQCCTQHTLGNIDWFRPHVHFQR